LDSFSEHDSGQKEQDQDNTKPTSEQQKLLTVRGDVKRLMFRQPTTEQTEMLLSNFEHKGISYFKDLLIERRKSP
jgi:hypothetical protein